MRAQAAFWLAQGRARGAPGEEGPIQLILDMPGASGRRARAGLLDAIGKSGDDRWADLVLTLAESDEPEVALAAVTAMSTIRDERFIPVLVRRLGVREGRSRVREAIVALGPPAFQALEAALDAPDVEARVRVHLPATIARFGDRQAADVLLRTLEDTKDGRLRYKVLRAIELLTAKTGLRLDRGILERRMLHDLREHFRSAALHRTFELALAEEGAMGRESGELLVGLLRDKRDQALDRVFSLLQASYPQEDLRAVRSAGRSSNRRRRAQAQEFLEALTLGAREPELRELLRVAVDDLPDDERLRRAQPLLEMPLARGLDSTVQELLRDPDLAVSSLAAYHVLESGRPSLRRVVIEETRERPLGDALQDILRRALIGEEATGLA